MPTDHMEPVIGRYYEPSEDDREARPDMLFLGREILLCPCGRENTWFSVLPAGGLLIAG